MIVKYSKNKRRKRKNEDPDADRTIVRINGVRPKSDYHYHGDNNKVCSGYYNRNVDSYDVLAPNSDGVMLYSCTILVPQGLTNRDIFVKHARNIVPALKYIDADKLEFKFLTRIS